MDRRLSLLRVSAVTVVAFYLSLVDVRGQSEFFSDPIEAIKGMMSKANRAVSTATPLKVDASGTTAAVDELTWTQRTLAKIQSTQIASHILTAQKTYNTATDIAKSGVAIYNTGRDALQFARMLSGDVSNMSDLKSWQAMFTRMGNQELNKIMASNNRLINFTQTYQNRFRRYLSPEGAVDVFAVARQYSSNPTLSYTAILRDMSTGTQQFLTEQCRVFLRDAESLEKLAAMSDVEAVKIKTFLFYDKNQGAFDALSETPANVDIGGESGLGKFNDKLNSVNTNFGEFLGTISGRLGTLERERMKREIENVKDGLPAMTKDQMSQIATALTKHADDLRAKAAAKRAMFNRNCGVNELFQQATVNAFWYGYTYGGNENRAGLR